MRIRTSSSTTKIVVLGLAGRWDGTVILSTHPTIRALQRTPACKVPLRRLFGGTAPRVGHARGQAPGVASIDQAKGNGRLSGYAASSARAGAAVLIHLDKGDGDGAPSAVPDPSVTLCRPRRGSHGPQERRDLAPARDRFDCVTAVLERHSCYPSAGSLSRTCPRDVGRQAWWSTDCLQFQPLTQLA